MTHLQGIARRGRPLRTRKLGLFASDPYLAVAVALPMTAAIVTAGFLLPDSQHVGSLLVVVPAATAALAGPRLTVAATVVACGASLAVDADDGLLHSSIFAVHLLALLLVSAIVIGFRSLRERNLRELIEVRTVSETIQRVLLRPLPPQIGPLSIRSAYHASDPYALIGGDLYASARTADAVRVVIGDVKGKGLAAVEDAAALLGAFRGVRHAECSLPEVVAELERSVRGHFEQAALSDGDVVERFITVLVMEIPLVGGRVRMINCGHPSPYLISPSGVTLLNPDHCSPPLGLGSVLPSDYQVDTVLLPPGAMLLLYTDGAIEARDRDGRFYDLAAHLADWRADTQPEELLQHVLDGLTAHVGGSRLEDDVALVAVHTGPSSTSSDPQLSGNPAVPCYQAGDGRCA
jgi:serine phosphatase RsbU (regulator of sigma subunit)